MHARHRSPGNGYRSGSMGMGLSASRISPEGSVKGHSFYNSEYRSFNRGFGRGQGQPKLFQPLPPTPLKSGDILMEAGQLAAEYLVSQGLLPPSVLFGKWQNGSLKKQVGDFQDFRSQESENLHLPPDGRASALSRLGNSASDAGLGRRRYMDDYTSTGSRSHLKGRRKGGSYHYSSDLSREYGRSGSWPDRSRASPDMEGDDDTISGHHEEQHVGNGLQKLGSGEFAPKSEEAGDSEPELDKYNLQDETHSKAGSSSAGKNQLHDGEVSKESDNYSSLNTGTGELKDGNSNDGTESQAVVEDSSIQHSTQEGDPSGKNSTDLLTLCKFARVPTKTRSSLTSKGSKVDSISNNEGTTWDIRPPGGVETLVEDDSPVHSSGNLLSNKIHDSKCPDSENSKALSVHSVEYVGDLGAVLGVEPAKCPRSQSFPDRVLVHNNEKESGQGLPCLRRSSSVVKERGEKRAVEESDLREGTKRQKEWLPSVPFEADECINLPSVNEKKESPQEDKPSHSEDVTVDVDDGSLVNNSQIPLGSGEPCVEYAQEKQLFPSSFKICDLNLVGASDMNENNHCDPMLVFPVISGTKKETGPVDVDLSMSSSSKSDDYSTRTSNGKEIEVIDLESDSTQEVKASDNLEKKLPAVFMSYSNSTQNAGDIPDVPDYNEGLMMAEFLNTLTSLPNGPPGINIPDDIDRASQDVNPLQNEMGLHSGEGTLGDDQGTLGDDDSIYMSLGEIPLSFLRAWDQPRPQEYEKPF